MTSTTPERSDHLEAYNALISCLPEPTPLAEIISDLRQNLKAFPSAMLGEVGLDRVFRVPLDYLALPRQLTPFIIPYDHQLAILEAQLDLAVELGRNVSMHSVKSQLGTTALLEKMQEKHGELWNRISIDMHSCGLSPETWREIEVLKLDVFCGLALQVLTSCQKKYNNVFLSLSTVINSRSPNHRALIAACSPNRILVESDYNDVDECTENTWNMVLTVAEVKGWHVEDDWVDDLEEGKWGTVRRLEQNWKTFQEGNHQTAKVRKHSKQLE